MKTLRAMYDSMPTLLSNEADPRAVRQFERLTWRRLDYVEMALLGLGGLLPGIFTIAVLSDVVTRMIGSPVSWLQELTLGCFVWGVFIGGTVAVRRRLHFRLTTMVDNMHGAKRKFFETATNAVVLLIALWLLVSGGSFAFTALGIVLQASGMPVALIAVVIPISGALTALFCLEMLVNGWTRGFDDPEDQSSGESTPNLPGSGVSEAGENGA